MAYRIALIGCGTVGTGFLKILRDKGALLKEKYGFEASIVAISDMRRGSVFCDKGLDIPTILSQIEAGKSLNELHGDANGLNAVDTIRKAKADMVMEITYTDIKTAEPATTHVKEAFQAGSHVVTTNKGPATLHYRDLTEMAKKHGVQFRYEGVVLSGTPVFDLAEFCLAGNSMVEIKGILNGTTNFMLSKMEQDGMAYPDALKLAQKLGYAEADPTADVEGHDALAKILMLANIMLGGNLKVSDAECVGISKITLDDIAKAKSEGKRYKLVASTKKVDGKVVASVKPVMLPLSDSLAGVMGANSVLCFVTDLSGPITIQGAGAGEIETGYALLIDALAIHRSCKCKNG